MTPLCRHIDTPVGRLELIADAAALTAILWQDDDPQRVRIERRAAGPRHAVLDATEQQLGEYFAGQRRSFTVPLAFAGTAFQNSVWQALRTIPYGQTRSYAQIAEQIGRPRASRAVGAANGRNPISIIAPCHRVIGANGALTGFAGGLGIKQQLLQLENGTGDLLSA